MDLLELAVEMHRLGLDAEPVLDRVERAIPPGATTDTLFGVPTTALPLRNEDELFDLLIDAYIVEKLEIAFPRRFSIDFHLPDILPFLLERGFVSHEEDPTTFEDHVFLATHIAYVLSDYGRIRLRESDFPELYDWLWAAFPGALERDDIEVVAEIVDVARSLGRTERDDPMVRKGTRMLLAARNPDGSWSDWRRASDPYDATHETWCAVMALRERAFLEGTPYGRRIRRVVEAVRATQGTEGADASPPLPPSPPG